MQVPLLLCDGAAIAAILSLCAIYFGAYFLKGTFARGALTPAVLFGTLIIGPHHAVVLAALAKRHRKFNSSAMAGAQATGSSCAGSSCHW